MKLPKFLPKRPALFSKPPKKRLQATARRVAQPGIDDYDEDEPTTKLSSAFIVVLIGEMADRIAASWGALVACEKAGSLAEAVERARETARRGDVVLFSPGTSSFDMFKNYKDRGDQFRATVQALTP